MVHTLDPAYRRNARWMMSDDALRVAKTIKDLTGRYMWQPNETEGEPDLLLGYPYVINQDMPAVAPSAKAVAFGDFSKYFIRRVAGASVKRLVERYADYNQIAFVAFQRWDGA
jgi:HK97 family phage major capsid protein